MAGRYIRRGEKIVGPVDAQKLRELAATGRLLPTDELAKDVAGPWHPAGSTNLFASSLPAKVEPPTVLAPLPPVVAEDAPQGRTAAQTSLLVFAAVGKGMLATGGAVGRMVAARSQRRHEIKLAKIQASAAQKNVPAPRERHQPVAAPAPVINQTTVVQIVNSNQQTAYGCGGCGTVLLLILLGILAFILFGDYANQPR